MEEKNRDPGLDVIRSIAIVFVLVIHTAAGGLTQTPGTFDWWSALLWGAPVRPAVPLFFMCSGALMLCRDITPRRIFTHNMPRILCAMFAWAFLYRLVALVDDGFTMAGLWDAAKRTILLQHEFHFYFLHMLILVYAFLPVARVFVRAASRRELEYLLGLWMVTGILIPMLASFWPFTLVEPLGLRYKMGQTYSCIGYALLGHYLRQYGGSIRRRWYALALLAGLAITAGGCAVLSLRGGTLNTIPLEGMTPGPMLTALGLFGLVITRKEWPVPVVKVTGRLAQAAFCIYLVHVLFQRLFLRLGISAGASPCLLSIPFVCLLLLAAGWLTWEVLHRVPIVKTYLV
ncbi:MAG: acyltransferase family protein [Oscillospiraceae bacterium]|nr:acyltransferase family protein [Oscillospiraceae bacterium]